MATHGVSHKDHVHRAHDWMPADHRFQRDWLSSVITHVDRNPRELHPVLEELKDLIERDTRIFLLVQSMFEQVPGKKPYLADASTEHRQVRDYQHMLELLNHSITSAPRWSDTSRKAGMVGLPINAALDWPMGTPSGFAFFLDPVVNAIFKRLLNVWGQFFQSDESAQQVLGEDPDGWLGVSAKHQLTSTANDASFSTKQIPFESLFACDPTKPYHGFTSWDDFFTRRFRFEDGVRPIASPEDDSVVVNAWESRPYNLAHKARLRDRFWIKGQPYSVADMLAHDKLARLFDGATVYQAFLSALSYHRWHAPVSGTVVKAFVEEGSYSSEPLFEGVGDPAHAVDGTIDESGETTSQGYLTAVATRAIIFINADNPSMGLMAFIAVGMAEDSTCEITVGQGQRIGKGQEMGMFHFGGSTHCLLFRDGVDVRGFPPCGPEHNVPVKAQLATVAKRA
ncbi:hypothetical protein WHR41_09437 [Cladosporium halotolerans]|uniref:L-tryptophan decarboxylase PsiD-like domain-containing protein n=1 Tax=Cladosporium halotolerans TaxID=1052096 RepID=A0AB34KF56_9PEZI